MTNKNQSKGKTAPKIAVKDLAARKEVKGGLLRTSTKGTTTTTTTTDATKSIITSPTTDTSSTFTK